MSMKNYITHDEAIELTFIEYEKADRRRYTDIFLASLSDRKRINVLHILGLMKTFPKHNMTDIPKDLDIAPELLKKWSEKDIELHRFNFLCDVCGNYANYYIEHIDGLNEEENVCIDDNIYEFGSILATINSLASIPKPTNKDFDIFIELISLLKNTDKKIRDFAKEYKKSDTFKKWVKLIKNYLKETEEDDSPTEIAEEKLQFILETLGFIGVLHTKEHKGSFYEFTHQGTVPTTSRSSNFSYPVDFWQGSDGVDMNALSYWFSDYEELKELFRRETI